MEEYIRQSCEYQKTGDRMKKGIPFLGSCLGLIKYIHLIYAFLFKLAKEFSTTIRLNALSVVHQLLAVKGKRT